MIIIDVMGEFLFSLFKNLLSFYILNFYYSATSIAC